MKYNYKLFEGEKRIRKENVNSKINYRYIISKVHIPDIENFYKNLILYTNELRK